MPGPFFWFFAIVALVTLATSIRFGVRPAERTLAILRPLCAATIFSALASFFLGVANGLTGLKWNMERVASNPGAASAVRPEVILGGVIESLAPLILSCAVVAVAWLLVAVGLRRQA